MIQNRRVCQRENGTLPGHLRHTVKTRSTQTTLICEEPHSADNLSNTGGIQYYISLVSSPAVQALTKDKV